MLPLKPRRVAVAAACALVAFGAWRAHADSLPPAPLNAAQIVEQMGRHNEARNEELKHYHSVRHYTVEYKGITTIDAGMEVEVGFDAASGKTFRIVSQSGSKFLCDKVLKRAVESEKEAAADKASTALTPANYKFELIGEERVGGRPAYILHVEPLAESKFLYRGKIWVDGADFALVKVEAEPAKNPSMWISRTQINFTSAKTGDFWLPEQNRSETKVRIGGTAVLTIRYGAYEVEPLMASATVPGLASSR